MLRRQKDMQRSVWRNLALACALTLANNACSGDMDAADETAVVIDHPQILYA